MAFDEALVGKLERTLQVAGINLLDRIVQGIFHRLEIVQALDHIGHILRIPLDRTAAVVIFDNTENPAVVIAGLPLYRNAVLDISVARLPVTKLVEQCVTVGRMDMRQEQLLAAALQLAVAAADQPRNNLRRLELLDILVIIPVAQQRDILGRHHAQVGLFELLLDDHLVGHVTAHTERVLVVQRENPVFVMAGMVVQGNVVMGSRTYLVPDHVIEVLLHIVIRLGGEQRTDIPPDKRIAGRADMVGLFRGDQIDKLPRMIENGQHIGQRLEYLRGIFIPETSGRVGKHPSGTAAGSLLPGRQCSILPFQPLDLFDQFLP